jgi:Protein of unknown function (DUF1275)
MAVAKEVMCAAGTYVALRPPISRARYSRAGGFPNKSALRRVGGRIVPTTYVTGMLTDLAETGVEYLYWLRDRSRGAMGHRVAATPRAAPRQTSLKMMLLSSGIWLAFVTGAITGGYAQKRWELRSLLLLQKMWKNVDSTFFFLLHSPQLTLKQTSTQRPQTPQSLRRCSHYRRATCPLVADRESSSLQMTWVSSLNEHGKTVPCLVMFFHGSIFTRQPLCRNRLKSNFQRT